MTDKPGITFTLPPHVARGLCDDDAEIEALESEDELDVIELLRQRLDIDDAISDVTIASSLAAIAAKGDTRARWLAAFSSPLGKWLAARGSDLNTSLNVLMSFAPKAAS